MPSGPFRTESTMALAIVVFYYNCLPSLAICDNFHGKDKHLSILIISCYYEHSVLLRQYFHKGIMIRWEIVCLKKGLCVCTILPAKIRAYFCKSIATQLRAIWRYLSQKSRSGVDMTLWENYWANLFSGLITERLGFLTKVLWLELLLEVGDCLLPVFVFCFFSFYGGFSKVNEA